MSDDEKMAAIMITGFLLLIGFMFGMMEQWEIGTGHKDCTYESIAGFAPGRVIACELFRKRFK